MEQKAIKPTIVPLSNASSQPAAMMIKPKDACTASTTMRSSWWPENLASFTEFQFVQLWTVYMLIKDFHRPVCSLILWRHCFIRSLTLTGYYLKWTSLQLQEWVQDLWQMQISVKLLTQIASTQIEWVRIFHIPFCNGTIQSNCMNFTLQLESKHRK